MGLIERLFGRRALSSVPTIQHKDFAWPVSPAWAAKHLEGRFAEMATWAHGHPQNDQGFDPERPTCWGRLWAILRKSDETFGQRTAGMSHEELGDLMRFWAVANDGFRAQMMVLNPEDLLEKFGLTPAEVAELANDPQREAKVERAKAILACLSPAELRELRAAEAHVIVRNRADFLLGRALSEFGLEFIDHAHGQGSIHQCGCNLLWVMDDAAMADVRADGSNRKTHHAHYPKKLCERHAGLFAVLGGKGTLSDKLEHIHMVVVNSQRTSEAA